MIQCNDSLEYLKTKQDYEFDINYSDPPYALGSEVIIRPDGKVDYKKANDFMSKWEMPTGAYWEQWFKEAYRTLKHGGYCIMFGMDRQLLLFKYYANLAGFTEQQSLYWYFISNFPKATDLSKQIDKNAGAERDRVPFQNSGSWRKLEGRTDMLFDKVNDIAITDLAKKYEGYKYSISPLKQTNETIMVFQKPYKTGSCLHDTLAYENGDETCCCGAFDIDGNRVGTEIRKNNFNDFTNQHGGQFGNQESIAKLDETQVEGRYPSQTLCDSNTAEVLDKQSGNLKQSTRTYNDNGKDTSWFATPQNKVVKGDAGGCSKILHKCNFEKEDYDIYNYQPKVSKSERNAGCDNLPIKERVFNGTSESSSKDIKDVESRFTTGPTSNNHPTLKPIALNEKILKLFKTPNDDQIVFPFAGAGSEVIGGIKAGFTNYCGCELSQEYLDIANARIEYWISKFKEENAQTSIFDFIGDD